MSIAHHPYFHSQGRPARPSERMDSYFPPVGLLEGQINMTINKRNSCDNSFTEPSKRTITVANFKRHSRAQSEGVASQKAEQPTSMPIPIKLEPPKPAFIQSDDKRFEFESYAEFKYSIQGKRNSLTNYSSSPLRKGVQQSSTMTSPSQIMPSLSSHFSDDSDSSDEEEEHEKKHPEESFGNHSTSSSSSSSSHHSSLTQPIQITSFTPPKTDEEVKSMISNFAILMRSSSQRQRLASVHLDGKQAKFSQRSNFKGNKAGRMARNEEEKEGVRGHHLNGDL